MPPCRTGRLRFSARVDGVGWFTGLADEVLRTESGAGRRLVLRGRGMDALLEDCEFDAQTGTGITPAALATRVLQPVGLSAWSDAQSATGTLKTALGSTGQLDRAGLLRLGRAPAAAYAGRRPGVPDGHAQERRHGAAGRARCGSAPCRRWRASACSTPRERPTKIRRAAAKRAGAAHWAGRRGGICPVYARSGRRAPDPAGTHALEPGTTAEVGGRTLTLTDCALRGSAAGITTELALAAL